MQARQYIKEQLISVLLEQNGIEDKKIKNPDTGREIKISSALSYDKDSSVFKKAKAFISKLFGKKKEEPVEKPVEKNYQTNSFEIVDRYYRTKKDNLLKLVTQRAGSLNVPRQEHNKKIAETKKEIFKFINQIPNISNKVRYTELIFKSVGDKLEYFEDLADKDLSSYEEDIGNFREKIIHPSLLGSQTKVTPEMNADAWGDDPYPDMPKKLYAQSLSEDRMDQLDYLQMAGNLLNTVEQLETFRFQLRDILEKLTHRKNQAKDPNNPYDYKNHKPDPKWDEFQNYPRR